MAKNEPKELDPNKIAAEFVQNNIENFVKLFILKHCGALVGWSGFKTHDQDTDFLVKKYRGNGDAKYELAKLNPEDEFIKDLFQKGSFFSVQTLQVMAKVRDILKEKTARKEASLDEILKSKN
jgi:hypothetical protein